jgi:NADH dehydrogenase
LIVVTGADGMVGSALRDVLAQGRRPWRELLRREAPALGGAAECVVGDVTDRATAGRALAGATAVIHLAGVSPGMKPQRPDHEVAAIDALLAAARDAPVERFVYLSASGADVRSTHAWSRAKGEAEERLRASGLPFTILRAGLLYSATSRPLEAWRRLLVADVKLRLPWLRGGRLLPLSAGDAAIALASALDHHKMAGRTIDIGAAPELGLERLQDLLARRLMKKVERGSFSWWSGTPLAEALARSPEAGLTDAGSWTRRFAIAEPPDLGEYDRLLPMRRVDFEEELRTYPWGAAPPRPGDPLPVLREAVDESLPMFMEGRGAAGGAEPGKDAARFGRVDPFGRIESDDAARRAGDPFRKPP